MPRSCHGAHSEPNFTEPHKTPLAAAAYLSSYLLVQVLQRLSPTQCDRGLSVVDRMMGQEPLHRTAVYAQPFVAALKMESPGKQGGFGIIPKKWMYTLGQFY